jgi:hypothetical protein
MQATEATTGMHPFEKSGLGKAPFRMIGFEIKVCGGPDANGMQYGAPGQPAGTCDHCGQGIKYCCKVRSADGKTFTVGMDCSLKLERASNKTFVAQVLTEKKKLQAEQRKAKKAKDLARVAEVMAALDNSTKLQEKLAALPHPTIEGKTLLDYVAWMRRNAGLRGMLAVLKLVEGAK